jgi:hypothetical protein
VLALLETLAGELERPRELSARVINYITGHYGIDDSAIGTFLIEELPKLEDYEIDLILSPVFTPKLADQAIVAEQLGSRSIPKEQWPDLVRQLATRPVRAQLVTFDGRAHSVLLREVTIERYVHRLRLEGTISEPLMGLIDPIAPSDRPMVRAIARQAIWENEGPRTILLRYLTTVLTDETFGLADTLQLLTLAESRKPANVEDLLARIPAWMEALRKQVDDAYGSKPFFNEDVRMLHGGGRDQRQHDDSRVSPKQMELEFLGRLQRMFAS